MGKQPDIQYTPHSRTDGVRRNSIIRIGAQEISLSETVNRQGGYSNVRFFNAPNDATLPTLVIKKISRIDWSCDPPRKLSHYQLKDAGYWNSDYTTFQTIYPERLVWSNIDILDDWKSSLNGKNPKETTDAPVVIIMEKFHGQTLNKTIGEYSIDMLELLDIFLAVAFALKKIHALGFVHGDVKEDNVNLFFDTKNKTWTAYWYDFNLSRKIGAATPDVFSCRYMAPELKDGPKPADPTQDIYSLGSIFKRCLSQSDYTAFRLQYSYSIVYKFNSLLKKMLSSNPQKRPSFDEIMTTLLFIKKRANKAKITSQLTINGLLQPDPMSELLYPRYGMK